MAHGIVVTGTRAAGKSTFAAEACRAGLGIAQVRAITTRVARADDVPGFYRHVPPDEFSALEGTGGLLIRTSYATNSYGIAVQDLEVVHSRGQLPLLVITPESAAKFAETVGLTWCFFFLDAADEVLDSRLAARGTPALEADWQQRAIDRAVPSSRFVAADGATPTRQLVDELLAEGD